jgi:hypothetical protein
MSNVIENHSRLQPPEHIAVQFLKSLDPQLEATFNIETYTDAPKGVKKATPDPLSSNYPTRTLQEVADLIPELEHLNREGAGIFVAVNQCYGRRNKANIVRIRGTHGDFDSATPEQVKCAASQLRACPEFCVNGV